MLTGYHLEVVPEALLWYRKIEGSMLDATPAYLNLTRSLRPYVESTAPHDGIVRLAVGAERSKKDAVSRLECQNAELSTALEDQEELVRKLREELARVRAQEPSDLDTLLCSARILAERDRGDTAMKILDEVETLATSMEHPLVVVNAMSLGAKTLTSLGEKTRAKAWLRLSLDAAQQTNDAGVFLRALLASARAYATMGDSERARQSLAQGVVLAHSANDRRVVASTWFDKGVVHAELGEDEEAWRSLERAAKDARSRGDSTLLCKVLLAMAPLAAGQLPVDQATSVALEATKLARESNSASLLLDAMFVAGHALRDLGRPDVAASIWGSASAFARQTGNAAAFSKLAPLVRASESERAS